jgi:predicted dehydrogenase
VDQGGATRELGIGLIGSGFMGRAHALAFRTVGGVFDLPLAPRLEMLADASDDLARQAAAALGFRRHTGDWKALVRDPAVDLVAITTPNALHKPMGLAAIEAGKHVYCEKPLAVTAADAEEMARAAEEAGVVTMVGFNYLRNPMIKLAKQIVGGGEIGEVTGFRGIFAEDYMADASRPFTWRCDPANAGGALADIGSHIISMARYLVGDIEEVCGRVDTVHAQRPVAAGSAEMRAVSVDDQANFLVRFARGVTGGISANWIATGQKMQLAFELIGTKGSIDFTQERLNELRLYTAGQPKGREGFKLLLAGPDHPDYGRFCPAPGHQLGFNDLKVIEVRELIEAIARGGGSYPDFREATEVARVAEAVVRSSQERRWVRIAEV